MEEHLDRVVDIIVAYVGANPVQPSELPHLISDIAISLSKIKTGETVEEIKQVPAIPIKRSVRHDCIFCLECGEGFKSMKRHLRAMHDLDEHEYRQKWNLPPQYPMAAEIYSAQRSALAKTNGFGRKKGQKLKPKGGKRVVVRAS
jgi:predicted transcriptional regulator